MPVTLSASLSSFIHLFPPYLPPMMLIPFTDRNIDSEPKYHNHQGQLFPLFISGTMNRLKDLITNRRPRTSTPFTTPPSCLTHGIGQRRVRHSTGLQYPQTLGTPCTTRGYLSAIICPHKWSIRTGSRQGKLKHWAYPEKFRSTNCQDTRILTKPHKS